MVGDGVVGAVSSAVGVGGRVIVRLTGAGCFEVCRGMGVEILGKGAWEGFLEVEGLGRVGCWVYAFVGPASYTGEDLVELHLPGGALLAGMVLGALFRRGVREAEAGEFTARGYFHGKMDLTQAEGVAMAVAAQSRAAALAAGRLLEGELSRRVGPMVEKLAGLLALLEAGIDFSDQEDVSFLSAGEIGGGVEGLVKELEALLGESERFERVGRMPTVVLAGRPNAGKSTLMNALAGRERAVVSEVAGTTRDSLSCEILLRRGMVRVVDVAGLEEGEAAGGIEGQMREKAMGEIRGAEVVVMVRDILDERSAIEIPREADLVVWSKGDLGHRGEEGVEICAVDGRGLEELRERLDGLAFGAEEGDAGAGLVLNARHVRAIEECWEALGRVRTLVGGAGQELVALELREGLDCLGRISGQVSTEDLLGRIFSAFCIGK